MNIVEAAKLAKEGKTLYSKSSESCLRAGVECGERKYVERGYLSFPKGNPDWPCEPEDFTFEAFLATDWEVVNWELPNYIKFRIEAKP